jgi:hypothetical protein
MGFGRETSTLALYICSFAIELFLLVLLVFMVTATGNVYFGELCLQVSVRGSVEYFGI